MPAVRPVRSARPLSALWVVGLAFVAVSAALYGGLPGWAARSGATQLADSHFVPDEAVLPAAQPGATGAGEDPAHAAASLTTDAPTMHWNGHADRLWRRADGRGFVVSPWGATWWQDGTRRQRTELDLPGLDPALGARRLADDRLLIPRPQGGAWLIDLKGTQPQLRSLSAEEASAI